MYVQAEGSKKAGAKRSRKVAFTIDFSAPPVSTATAFATAASAAAAAKRKKVSPANGFSTASQLPFL
jgi:hypothetical protein